MADWAKIKAEYIADQSMSYRKLAKKHRIAYRVLASRAKTEKWVELRNQKLIRSASAVVDACATKEAEKAIKIYEAADMALEVIMARLRGPDSIDPQAIKSLTSALKDIAAVKGIQTEAERREQEARIAKLRREAEQKDDSGGVEIIMPEELKRFCQ